MAESSKSLSKTIKALPGYGWVALFSLAAAEILLFSRLRPVTDYFYMLAWWPYIFLVDAVIKARSGHSPIFQDFRNFLYLLPWSVTIWLIFEFFNFRLSNWHYIDIEPSLPMRWAGYWLSFATVLPGLFITERLIEELGLLKNASTPAFAVGSRTLAITQIAGGIMLVLPVLFPKYFFPLVWGGFALLLEPINLRAKAPSLLGELSAGRPGRIYRLLAAGLVCGFLWEFWNYWATAKWIYTVPFVGELKLFEMPVAGFLGFPPFALECFVMYVFISVMGGAPQPAVIFDKAASKNANQTLPLTAIYLVSLPFWCCAFYFIDTLTVQWS